MIYRSCILQLVKNGKEISPEEHMADKYFMRLKERRERKLLLKSLADDSKSFVVKKCSFCPKKDSEIAKLLQERESYALLAQNNQNSTEALKSQLTTTQTEVTTLKNERESILHRLDETTQENQRLEAKVKENLDWYNSLLVKKERENLELSKTIQRLEKQFGKSLIERSPDVNNSSTEVKKSVTLGSLSSSQKKSDAISELPKTPLLPIRTPTQKFPFTLYESCMEDSRTETASAKEVAGDFLAPNPNKFSLLTSFNKVRRLLNNEYEIIINSIKLHFYRVKWFFRDPLW